MTRQKGWYWTPDRVVAAMQVFEEIYGRQPSWTDFNPGRRNPVQRATFQRDGCWPSGATVIRHWGSWNAAIRAAGYEPVAPGAQPHPAKDAERCPNGHLYTPENTAHRRDNGFRVCRICRTEARRRSYEKNYKGPGSRAKRGMPQSDHPKHKVVQ